MGLGCAADYGASFDPCNGFWAGGCVIWNWIFSFNERRLSAIVGSELPVLTEKEGLAPVGTQVFTDQAGRNQKV